MEFLKPCTFCGFTYPTVNEGRPAVTIREGKKSYQTSEPWYVICGYHECLATGPVADSRAEAVAKWNTRKD